jgi:hypothetical protein
MHFNWCKKWSFILMNGKKCGHRLVGEDENTQFRLEYVLEISHFEDQEDERLDLKETVKMGGGWNWLRIVSSGGP